MPFKYRSSVPRMDFSIRSSEKCLFSISGQLTPIFFIKKQFSRPLNGRHTKDLKDIEQYANHKARQWNLDITKGQGTGKICSL